KGEDRVDVHALPLRGRGQAFQELERLPIVRYGLGTRVELPRSFGGVERVGQSLLPIFGPPPMMGEQRRPIGGRGRFLLEKKRQASMEGSSLVPQEARVPRLLG